MTNIRKSPSGSEVNVAEIPVLSDDVVNESAVAGMTVTNALDALKTTIAGLTSSAIANVSSVVGATVTTALNTLSGIIAALTSSNVSNASSVTGATVTAALDALKAAGVYPAPGGGVLRVPVGGGAAAPLAGTSNGQLFFWDQTAGRWTFPSAAPADDQLPQWDAATNTWTFIPLPSIANLQYFDTTHSPTGLWNFNGTLADSSGNGFDMVLSAGAIGYADIAPGKKGVLLGSTAILGQAAANTALKILGDVTLEMIVQLDSLASLFTAFSFAASGETQATNTAYLLRIPAVVPATPPRQLTWLSESGAGVDATYANPGPESIGLIHNIMYIAATRISNVVQFYVNGLPFGAPSAALTPPDGATSSKLFIGCDVTTSPGTNPIIFSAKVIASGLNAAQIKAEYNRTMGPAYGVLT